MIIITIKSILPGGWLNPEKEHNMNYRLINFSTMKVIREFETLRDMVVYFNTEFIDDLENVLMQEYNFKHKRFESIL